MKLRNLIDRIFRREPESNLVSFARDELQIAGLLDKDSAYDGMLGEAALEIVKTFSKQGHSGYSAALTTDIVTKLMQFEPLTPLTGGASEWNYVGEQNGFPLYQNRRCSHVFKEGDRAYDNDGMIFREPNGVTYANWASRVDVTFPYVPHSEYVDVPASEE